MSAFDDYSHQNQPPAAMELYSLLNFGASEFELFEGMPVIEFVGRFRRYLDRGTKLSIITLGIRAARESYNAKGHGNRARRRAEQLRRVTA